MGERVEYSSAGVPLESLIQLNGDYSNGNFVTPTAYTTQEGETILILPQFSTLVLTGEDGSAMPIQQFVTAPFSVQQVESNGPVVASSNDILSEQGYMLNNSAAQCQSSILPVEEYAKTTTALSDVLMIPAASVELHDEGEVTTFREPYKLDDISLYLQDDGLYHCNKCDATINKLRLFKRHLYDHKNEKPWKCRTCSSSFNVERNLILHEASHNLTPNSSCPICKKRFLRVAGLCSHLRIHQVDDTLACENCEAEFDLPSELSEHIDLVHGNQQNQDVQQTYKCGKCNVVFSNGTHYRKHMAEHRFIDKSIRPLRRVRRSRLKQANVEISLVSKSVDEPTPSNDQAATESPPKKRGRGRLPNQSSHKCKHCEKNFRSKMLLDRHVLIHTGERPFSCDQCGKSFNQKSALSLHKLCHTGEKPHHCQFCFASFTQRGNLRAHIKSCHRIPQDVSAPGVYRCQICSCTFKRLSTYNAHVTFRHVEPSLEIDAIERQGHQQRINNPSHYQAAFEQHEADKIVNPTSGAFAVASQPPMMIVGSDQTSSQQPGNVLPPGTGDSVVVSTSNEYVSRAEVVGAEGSESANKTAQPGSSYVTEVEEAFDNVPVIDPETNAVRNHRVSRINGILYHCCSFCTKQFRKTSDFLRHVRIHTCEKPFTCALCNSNFTNKSTLYTHMRVHAGPAAKRFRCHVCRKMLASTSSLKVHLRVHTGARPYSCSFCDKKFRTSSHRQEHMLVHQKTKQLVQQHVMAQSHQKQQDSAGLRHFLIPGDSCQDESSILPATLFGAAQSESFLQEAGIVATADALQLSDSAMASQITKVGNEAADSTRKYHCNFCPKSYKKSDHLRYHVESAHGNGERSFICRICGKQFAMWAVLRNHIRTHARRDLANCDRTPVDFLNDEDTEFALEQAAEASGGQPPQIDDLVEQAAEPERFDLVGVNFADMQQKTSNEVALVPLPRMGTIVDDFSVLADTDHLCFHCGQCFPSEALVRAHVSLEHQDTMSCQPEEASHQQEQPLFNEHQPSVDLMPCGNDRLPVHNVDDSEPMTVPPSWIPVPDVLPELSLSLLQPSSIPTVGPAQPAENVAADSLMVEHTVVTRADVPTTNQLEEASVLQQETNDDPGLLELALAARQECPTIIIAEDAQHSQDAALPLASAMSPTAGISCITKSKHGHNRSGARGDVSNVYIQEAAACEFRCTLCGAVFYTKQSISRHMTDMHSNKSAFTCSICNRQLSSKNALMLHSTACAKKLNSASFQPDIINDGNSASFGVHTYGVATGAQQVTSVLFAENIALPNSSQFAGNQANSKPHACKFCSRSFSKPSDLVRHERIHTGDRPFRCDQCGRSFRLKSALVGHQSTHLPADERTSFTCHLCKAKLGSRTSLVVHLRRHTGATPYSCPHCPEKFPTAGRRQSHILSLHLGANMEQSQHE